jgi:hypothetical protein
MTETERNLLESMKKLKDSMIPVALMLRKEEEITEKRTIDALKSHGAWVRQRQRLRRKLSFK